MAKRNPRSQEKEARRTVRTFAAASFLNDMGSDMIYPIWPLFVVTFLNVDMTILGLIDGLGDAIVSISQAISGYVSDRIKRRKVFIWTGYVFGGVSRVGYALSTAWQQLIPFKVLDRAGKMRGAPRDAIVADISKKKSRGGRFGLIQAMDNLGAVMGIVITILLFGILGYTSLFLLAAIPSGIAVILILFLIKERKSEGIKIYKGLSLKQLDGNFRFFLILSAIFALGSFSYSFLLIYAKQFGIQLVFIPVLYLLFTLVAFFFSFPFGKLSDRIGRKPVLMAGFAFWGLLLMTFILVQSYLAIILVFILYGLHRGVMDTVQKTFVADLAPKDFRASTLGGFQMVVGLCALPASLFAGIFWDQINLYIPLYFSLALTAIALVMLMFVKEK